jgi:TolA-binding protein
MLLIAVGKTAAASSEVQLLNAAEENFKGWFYDRAESLSAEFIQKFPTSPYVPDAVLLQARSRLEQSNYAGAMQLLVANENALGAKKDEIAFWMGETRLREGKYPEAAKLFRRVTTEFSSSPRRSEAALKQAVAGARLDNWQNVVEVLGAKDGVFQQQAATNAESDTVLQGFLLLSEAHLKLGNYAAAQTVLEPLGKRALSPTNAWAWNYLRSQAQLQAGNAASALDITSNMVALAGQTGLASFQAESARVRGEIFERMGRLNEALAAYTNNLSGRTPLERQRQAVLKVAQLSVAQKKAEDGARILDAFLAQNPQAAAADVAWIAAGELRLRQFVETITNQAPATNLLDKATAAFLTASNRFEKSPLFGMALMDLGWCYWFSDKTNESRGAFASALQHLSAGVDRARAHFKLGDAYLRAGEFAPAITNYDAVLRDAATPPLTETNLLEPALYQIVRAGLAGGNLAAASNALSRIVTEYPKGFYADRGVLLYGQRMGKERSPAEARRSFEEFMKKVPEAALRPELELAIARTYEQERDWPKAITVYNQWLETFTNHPARPEAMFYRGEALFRADDDTNAYSSFTNFMALYPSNALAAQAQWSIADHYYNIGSFQRAENDYQIIARNWPGTRMGYEALMMAGRAAFRRQGWSDAAKYFRDLAKETNCPVDIRFEAIYAVGDTLMNQVSTNKMQDYRDAAGYFDSICQQYPTSYLAPLACGERALCLLQLAHSGTDLGDAADAFRAVITNSVYADGKAISIAKVGLGVVLEKQAAATNGDSELDLRKQALGQYMDVLDGLYLKEHGGDEFWTKEAGLSAIRLASDMQEWEKVVKICERMAGMLPQLAPTFDEQKRKALENSSRGKIAGEKFDR